MRPLKLSTRGLLLRAIVGCAFLVPPACLAQSVSLARVNVHVIADEAEAVLVILAKREAHQPVTEADWRRVFESEGYVRLKRREQAMKRVFEDREFKAFCSFRSARRALSCAGGNARQVAAGRRQRGGPTRPRVSAEKRLHPG